MIGNIRGVTNYNPRMFLSGYIVGQVPVLEQPVADLFVAFVQSPELVQLVSLVPPQVALFVQLEEFTAGFSKAIPPRTEANPPLRTPLGSWEKRCIKR